jgi:hypothetical protein
LHFFTDGDGGFPPEADKSISILPVIISYRIKHIEYPAF